MNELTGWEPSDRPELGHTERCRAKARRRKVMLGRSSSDAPSKFECEPTGVSDHQNGQARLVVTQRGF